MRGKQDVHDEAAALTSNAECYHIQLVFVSDIMLARGLRLWSKIIPRTSPLSFQLFSTAEESSCVKSRILQRVQEDRQRKSLARYVIASFTYMLFCGSGSVFNLSLGSDSALECGSGFTLLKKLVTKA